MAKPGISLALRLRSVLQCASARYHFLQTECAIRSRRLLKDTNGLSSAKMLEPAALDGIEAPRPGRRVGSGAGGKVLGRPCCLFHFRLRLCPACGSRCLCKRFWFLPTFLLAFRWLLSRKSCTKHLALNLCFCLYCSCGSCAVGLRNARSYFTSASVSRSICSCSAWASFCSSSEETAKGSLDQLGQSL